MRFLHPADGLGFARPYPTLQSIGAFGGIIPSPFGGSHPSGPLAFWPFSLWRNPTFHRPVAGPLDFIMLGLVSTQRLLGLSMEDPTPPLDTPELVGGLKTRLCEGPKFRSLWVANGLEALFAEFSGASFSNPLILAQHPTGVHKSHIQTGFDIVPSQIPFKAPE